MNKNDVQLLLGAPSTVGVFDDTVWIYIERTKTRGKLLNLGKNITLKNNVLVLKIDNKGLLSDKKMYKLDDMDKNYEFTENITSISYKNNSFVYNLLSTIKQRINAPVQRTKTNK